jgi:hypothetical protein
VGAFDRPWVTLLLVALLATCGVAAAWDRPWELDLRGRRLAAIALTAAAAVILVLQANGRVQAWGTDGQVAEWGVFHYYLGGKYFDELQYTDLYASAVQADADRWFSGVEQIRDLTTYKFMARDDALAAPRAAGWTDPRWEEFQADVSWFGPRADGPRWSKILRDRGFNPPPSYVLIGGGASSLLSIRNPVTQTLLINLDMLLLLLALALSTRAYGYLRSIFVLLVFFLWYGNANRIYGQVLILGWFAASWMAMSAWTLRKPGLSGLLVGYAASMRIFPAVLLAGPILATARRMLRERRVPQQVLRFVGGAAAAVGCLLVLSVARYGPDVWIGFVDNMSSHIEQHEHGRQRFGLKQIFTLDWRGRLSQPLARLKPSRNLRKNAALYRAAEVGFVVLALVAMARSDEHDAMLIGTAIFFAAMIASRYYGALLVLLLLMGCGSGARGPPRARWLRLSDASIVALILAVNLELAVLNRGHGYLFSNALWTAWWLVFFAWVVFRPSLQPKVNFSA